MQKEPEPWELNIVPQDMQDALAKFNAEAKRILDSSLGYLESVEPPPSSTITQMMQDSGEFSKAGGSGSQMSLI
jgi:hypothetical protein